MRQAKVVLIPFLFTLIFISACDNVSSNDSITTSREECDGVPDCTSVEASELTSIDGDGHHVLHFICPDQAPNIHNMDVDQNDNIIVEVLDWSENAVTVSFRKQVAEMSALYQPFLGCSTETFVGGERFRGRTSIPDGLPDDPSEVPTEANFRTPVACSSEIPNCMDVLSKLHKIGHLKTHKDDLECPNTHPWYAAYNDTTSSVLVSVTENPASKLRFDGRGDSFLITNWSPIHDHHWQISIACSAGCTYAPGGCPCGDKKLGCRNDPGCRTTMPRTSQCSPDHEECWTVWEETCPDGEVWTCNTTLGWVCCDSCT
ncbi:MAG: hypothetical protein DHS20C13_07220 [Thermodesulfobacteriota bacterium]|nr:MAG: hypothetical protein DHS20C13_07220 [Thermodesulfobacteriota bacterium]